MKEYLSYLSAASLWDIPYINEVMGYKISEASSKHITVTDHNARFRDNGKKIHSCAIALPAGAIVNRNGRMVSSPELLFLELATELSIHRLILLGLQLCSHPPGLPDEAITTKQRLKAFLAKTAGHRGHRKAMWALKYVENGSASIMESLTYMILGLPHNLGGYGLDDMVFNYEIKLKSDAQVYLKQDRCFLDIFYKKAMLAVEYDSFTHHKTPLEQGKDVMRSTVLKKQGIEVMHLSTIQLYNSNICREFAYDLAKRLGRRMQIRSKRFDEMHALIRTLLPLRNDRASEVLASSE